MCSLDVYITACTSCYHKEKKTLEPSAREEKAWPWKTCTSTSLKVWNTQKPPMSGSCLWSTSTSQVHPPPSPLQAEPPGVGHEQAATENFNTVVTASLLTPTIVNMYGCEGHAMRHRHGENGRDLHEGGGWSPLCESSSSSSAVGWSWAVHSKRSHWGEAAWSQ